MSENNGDCGEMLPIPPELLPESQKQIGIVMDTGLTVDLSQQGITYKHIQKLVIFSSPILGGNKRHK